MKGTLIKQHRKFNNMTLEELADGICSVSYLSKIEHDSISASDEIYRLLEQRLNIKLVDINDEYDEGIFNHLIKWYEAIQHGDVELIKQLEKKLQPLLETNQNIELNHLYKVIKAISDLKITDAPLSDGIIEKLDNIYEVSTKQFRFFYHKAIGVHYHIKNQFKKALQQFIKTKDHLKYVPFEDNMTYFHLCLTYVRTRQCVESIYYGEKALEGFINDLNYARIIDTYMVIALNYRYLDAHEIAEKYFLKLLQIGKYHLQPLEQRRIYHNLGFIYAKQGKFEDALNFLKQAEKIKTSEKHFEVSTIYMLSSTCFYLNDIAKCWYYLEKGEQLAFKYQNRFYQYKFFMLRHTIEGSTREDEYIKSLEKDVIPGVRQAEEYEDFKNLLEIIGDAYYEKRMYKKAASYYKEANTFKFTQKKDLL